jgi:hypothetical protein
MTDEYNGWTNRETWAVYTYLINTQSTQDYWSEEIKRLKRIAVLPDGMCAATWTEEQYVRYTLAERLREEHETAQADVIDGQSSRETRECLADIGSLWRVDWYSVARALIGGTYD